MPWMSPFYCSAAGCLGRGCAFPPAARPRAWLGDYAGYVQADALKQYDALFGDCAPLEKPSKVDWKDFGDHVAAYEAACPAI